MTPKSNFDDEFRHQIVERRTFALAGTEFPCYPLTDGRCVADASDVLWLIVGMESAWECNPAFRANVRAFSEWIGDDVHLDDELDDTLDPLLKLKNG
jgi:hypothetical protein